ncbi:MAG: TetR/AcrR family transcriptional regulator [Flavobacteriales bacterium]|nr:MAG: TetR/AcrR family transcriptional regulator [Flavobacteriales bacterium]
MMTKSEKTTKYILEKVAPIFNQKGYSATSMSNLTAATGLTKGAIYGNFKNKEELAIKAFHFSINQVLKGISIHQNKNKSPLQKLYLITDFYKNYYDFSKKIGGCPILNIGVNEKNQNNKLHHEVMLIINKTQLNIAKLIDQGKENGLINKNIDSINFARRLYSHIQGAVFMTYTMNDNNYLYEAIEEMNLIIKNELERL